MNPSELLYIDHLNSQVFEKLEEKHSVFVSDTFSEEFYKTICIKAHHLIFSRGPILNKKNQYFDCIIERKEFLESTDELSVYKKHLRRNGVIALCLNNTQSKLLHQSQQSISLLSRISDEKMHQRGFTVVFREPIGKLRPIGTFSSNNLLNKIIAKVGKLFPDTALYSPAIIAIYKYSNSTKPLAHYTSSRSLVNRAARVKNRYVYKFKNHPINDSYLQLQRWYLNHVRTIKSVLGIHRRNFGANIIPSIPVIKPLGSKQTLVLVMTYLQVGGVERVVLNILKGLDRDKFIIHLITTVPSKNEWEPIFRDFVDKIIHTNTVIDSSWPEKYRERYLKEYIVRNKADVLFITNSSSAYAALPQIKQELPNLRTYDLLHTHGTPLDDDAYLKSSMPADPYIDKRIVIDEYLKKYYCKKYPVDPNKVVVIYNGLDKKTLSYDAKSHNKEGIFAQAIKDKVIITYIGRLESDKSPLRLIEIAHQLKNTKVCIMVVGDGSLMKPMRARAERLNLLDNTIIFHGASSDPLPIMNASAYTLLVSNAEGVPMSILESMSVHTPVVASAVGGIPEIIESGVDGFLVDIDPDAPEEVTVSLFVSAIRKAVAQSTMSRLKMQLASRKKIEDKFSSMSEIYQKLFETGNIKEL